MISASNIWKSYRTDSTVTQVLHDVTFSAKSGDFVCISGRSGSGKSTFLNILSTLLRPDDGSVLFEGTNIIDFSENQLNLLRQNTFSMIFQFHHLMPYLSAVENVLLPYLHTWKPVSKNDVQRAFQCLERVGLKGKHDRLPGQLSGGEQQRVAIARSLIKSPRVLFADEPTGNLDKKTGDSIMDLLSALNREGLTILMVSHEESYTYFANRTVVMEDGALQE